MRDVGEILRLQIQRSSLKTGEKPNRRYDPAPLLTVERLAVTPDGVLGQSDGGAWLVDVHHHAHPQTNNEDSGATLWQRSQGRSCVCAANACRWRHAGHTAYVNGKTRPTRSIIRGSQRTMVHRSGGW